MEPWLVGSHKAAVLESRPELKEDSKLEALHSVFDCIDSHTLFCTEEEQARSSLQAARLRHCYVRDNVAFLMGRAPDTSRRLSMRTSMHRDVLQQPRSWTEHSTSLMSRQCEVIDTSVACIVRRHKSTSRPWTVLMKLLGLSQDIFRAITENGPLTISSS